jgi:hypothetical protein
VPLDVRPTAAAQRSRAIKTRGLQQADRKVNLFMVVARHGELALPYLEAFSRN